MRAELWQRTKDIFSAALDRTPGERHRYLEQACAGDAQLRAEVESLLAAHDDADGFIEQPAAHAALGIEAEPPAASWIGRRVGVYRVVEEVGRGGISEVYRAVRADDEFHRDAAVKVLRRGFDIDSLLRRFRIEKQILASLDHPNIARLLDAGSTEEGQPYLVMDYIQGRPIDEHCKHHRLPVSERLLLFRALCSAVQYVHGHLMVHGDLKCSNILVTHDGVVKLLDFGIARLLNPTPAAPDAKLTGLIALTPEYASPEQIRGQPITTASDIYSLGVVLYRLLAGALPYRRTSGFSYELATQICEQEPLPPSMTARFGDAAETRVASRRLRGDLDNIVMLALQKEPAKRYSSVEQFDQDVRRHVEGFPVVARGASTSYLLMKFVRRHKLSVAAAVLLVLSLVGGIWRVTYERDRAVHAESVARIEAGNAQQVADYLVSMFEAASPERAGALSVLPRDMVDRARRELSERLVHQPTQRARALAALGRIYLQLWLPESAAEALQEAVQLQRASGESTQLAEYLYTLGYVYNVGGRAADGEPVLREAVAIQRRTRPDDDAALADELSTLAMAQTRNGKPQEAIATIRAALVHAEASDGPAGKRVGESLYALAQAQLQTGHLADADASARRSLALLRALLPADAPSAMSALITLAKVSEARGEQAYAETLLREALDEQLKTLDPGSFWAVSVRSNLARAIAAQGRRREAAELYELNRDLLRRKHAENTPTYHAVVASLADLEQDIAD